MTQQPNNAALAAIMFAQQLGGNEANYFIDLWCFGEFDECRSHWPEAPVGIYIGADPLYKPENT